MYKKYKRVKKRKRILSVKSIIFIMLVLMICISTGYSLWSTNLNINGRIFSKIDTPPVVVVPDDGGETGGGTEDGTGEFVKPDEPLPDAELGNQTIEGNTLNVDYIIKSETGRPRSISVNLNLKNTSSGAISNGIATTQNVNNSQFFSRAPIVQVPTPLQPGEVGTVTVTFNELKYNKLGTGTVTYKIVISYISDNGVYEFNINMNFHY